MVNRAAWTLTGTGWPSNDGRVALRRWERRMRALRSPTCRTGDHSQCVPDEISHGVCIRCGKTIKLGQNSAPPERRACHPCRREHGVPYKESGPFREPHTCELCGVTFTPRYRPRTGTVQRWCSKSCAQAWRNGARPPYVRPEHDAGTSRASRKRRRLVQRAETWDGVTDAQIMERDRWRCGICGQRIGKSFKYPHPRSKSIDHIVPLSEGGDDTAANKRAAHLGCNCGRMNRGGGEQLAMIG